MKDETNFWFKHFPLLFSEFCNVKCKKPLESVGSVHWYGQSYVIPPSLHLWAGLVYYCASEPCTQWAHSHFPDTTQEAPSWHHRCHYSPLWRQIYPDCDNMAGITWVKHSYCNRLSQWLMCVFFFLRSGHVCHPRSTIQVSWRINTMDNHDSVVNTVLC